MAEFPSTISARYSRPIVVALLLFALFATGYRTYVQHYPGPNRAENTSYGFCDFYNGIYFPTRAFLSGQNPYSKEVVDHYPVSRPVPFFSPLVFLVHAPLTFLPKTIAATVYFFVLISLTFLLSWLAIQLSAKQPTFFSVALAASLLMVSRPGHISIFNGYFTLELAIGTLLAIHFSGRSTYLATLGIVLTSFKPTYAIPIFILTVARGYWRPAFFGAAISTVFAFSGLIWISGSYSPSECLEIVFNAQSSHHEFSRLWPENTWTRLDLLCIAGKWLNTDFSDRELLGGMVVLLAIPCYLLWRQTGQSIHSLSVRQSASGPAAAICALSVLVAIYHHFYDAIILVPTIIGILNYSHNDWQKFTVFDRRLILTLIAIPFVNYFSAKSVIDRLGLNELGFQIFTSVNGVCLALALMYLLIRFWQIQNEGQSRENLSANQQDE